MSDGYIDRLNYKGEHSVYDDLGRFGVPAVPVLQAQLVLVGLRVIKHIHNGPAREEKALKMARLKRLEDQAYMDYIAVHG